MQFKNITVHDLLYCDVLQVKDLGAAGKEFNTLPVMIDGDVRSDTVRLAGSHTRNLLRVKRGVDMVRILFQHVLMTLYGTATPVIFLIAFIFVVKRSPNQK